MPNDHYPRIKKVEPETIRGWIIIAFFAVSSVISLVWFSSKMNTAIGEVQGQAISDKSHNEVVNAQQQKEIDELKYDKELTDKSINQLNTKIDVMMAIVQRIDQKVGTP